MLLSVLKNVDRTDIFTADCGYFRGKLDDRFQGFYRVLWKPGMRHKGSSRVSGWLLLSRIPGYLAYRALSRHSTTIFRNREAEFGRLVLAELGGDGVILIWLADEGGEGENCPRERTLASECLLVSVRLATTVWTWRSCGVRGGLGTTWDSDPADTRLVKEGFRSKENCLLDSESFRLCCLWYEHRDNG